MTIPTLPGTIPYPLGGTGTSLATGVPAEFDVGIAGHGYLLSTLDQESPFEFRAYSVFSVPLQKPRIDTSEEPGEQTLEDWWSRAQHSWHDGSGQKIFDSPFSSRFGFNESRGLDPWTDGQIHLLKTTAMLDSGDFNDYHLHAETDWLFYSKNGHIIRINDLDTPTAVDKDPALGTVLQMASNGTSLYAIFNPVGGNGIQGVSIEDFATDPFVKINNLSPDLMGFVKNRLIAAVGPSLHEITDFGDVANGATPHFTHFYPGWKWTDIAETSSSIFVSGYSGDHSQIMAISFDATDAQAGLTLGVPAVAWEAPEGEIIYGLAGYLGKALLIGTTFGLRNGTVDETGSLQVGPLVVEVGGHAVHDFTFQGDYAWFSWCNLDTVYGGLGRISLGDLAYCSDIMAEVGNAHIHSVVDFKGRPVFSANGAGAASGIYFEHATDLVESGYFTTGEIRFGTLEKKAIRHYDALVTGAGTIDLEMNTDNTGFIANLTDLPAGLIRESLSLIGVRFEGRVTLNRDTATAGPTLIDHRWRAEPQATGRFRFYVPVMLYDSMTRLNGKAFGRFGYAHSELSFLMGLYRNGSVFKLQLPGFGQPGGPPPTQVKMEDLQFKAYTPPSGASGVGGIALVVMREQG